ncbi:GNAT family N-acetyltransferase [Ornithinimicrobium panacihumi]|uniref:GNAT family N-acetyltransferase n=1 Tax=Ornithinimicrobium panacihumi TaxID=2008449 RepID=UPI003F8ABA10
MSTDISRQTGPDRFEITVDGQVAGFAQFVDHDGRRVFFHTETRPEFSGQGLAGQVVEHALAATRDEGLRIVAVCPYVKKWLETHEGYGDLLDAATPDLLGAIPRS